MTSTGKGRPSAVTAYDVVVVGGGAAGLAAAASLLRRRPDLAIAVIEPQDEHYYQPGWTMVGAGVFDLASTVRRTSDVMPARVAWLKGSVVGFDPAANTVVLGDEHRVRYSALVVAPGLKLDWDAVEGLSAALGSNGVTSNYRHDLAPYTWDLVRGLRGGRALFTQPAMPIKCAGAPQKAMYLSADHWRRAGTLAETEIEFHTAAAVLFGIPHYVPALMDYVRRYGIQIGFNHRLVGVDGPNRRAWFKVTGVDCGPHVIERGFDLLHVCPPQRPPEFVRLSALADPDGWLAVDPGTLQNPAHTNIFALGDACSAPNAKTAAAARKQAPVVAANLMAVLEGRPLTATYDGYGSCPLTVERGRIVLAEFGYGGRLIPTFPAWLLNGTKPTRRAWLLKSKILPMLYWQAMLKGREWATSSAPRPSS